MAPEVLADVGLGNGYTKAVDIWSIGVIMFIWFVYINLCFINFPSHRNRVAYSVSPIIVYMTCMCMLRRDIS